MFSVLKLGRLADFEAIVCTTATVCPHPTKNTTARGFVYFKRNPFLPSNSAQQYNTVGKTQGKAHSLKVWLRMRLDREGKNHSMQ